MNYLAERFPLLRSRLPIANLAEIPTAVSTVEFIYENRRRKISVKHDNLSSTLYGGNKVRKLEYLLCPPARKNVKRFATFGTVGSHHALATSLYAKQLGFPCTCFLAHQRKTDGLAATLNMHLALGTEMVRYGGAYPARMRTIRDNLWGRNAWVVPAGGSSWLGTVGFVNAGLELAAQITSGQIEEPDRLYVACGTMGTAAGITLGLALVGLNTEVHAVRVSHPIIANKQILQRLMKKTAHMLRRLDASFPQKPENYSTVRLRHAFFAGGYAHSNSEIAEAIRIAYGDLGLVLEPTYTGKAMAALLHDLHGGYEGNVLFWNTYNSVPLPASDELPDESAELPGEFRTYFG